MANRATGDVRYKQDNLGFQAFAAAMFGRCLQFKATNTDLDWSTPLARSGTAVVKKPSSASALTFTGHFVSWGGADRAVDAPPPMSRPT